MGLFITKLWTAPQEFFLIALIVVFSICLHEYCHARCALMMGDPTAADRGHLTLNPFRQMGVFSLIMFLIAGIAWGMVPVDPEKARSRYPWGPAAIALAGPAANFALALIGWLAFGFFGSRMLREGHDAHSLMMSNLLLLIFLLGVYNIILLIFNLIPAPGLDGWNALCTLFPSIGKTSSETLKGVMIFLIFAVFMGVRYLFQAAYWIMFQSVAVFDHLMLQ